MVAPLSTRRIYVASSWRNTYQPDVVNRLRKVHGHPQVYDFRNPLTFVGEPEGHGFSWSTIDPNYKQWTPELYVAILTAEAKALRGFKRDFDAMQWANTFVLLLPCSRSAHLEAGWALGRGLDTFIFIAPEQFEPDLMYLLAGEQYIYTDLDEMLEAIDL
jgi:hypothetical protein